MTSVWNRSGRRLHGEGSRRVYLLHLVGGLVGLSLAAPIAWSMGRQSADGQLNEVYIRDVWSQSAACRPVILEAPDVLKPLLSVAGEAIPETATFNGKTLWEVRVPEGGDAAGRWTLGGLRRGVERLGAQTLPLSRESFGFIHEGTNGFQGRVSIEGAEVRITAWLLGREEGQQEGAAALLGTFHLPDPGVPVDSLSSLQGGNVFSFQVAEDASSALGVYTGLLEGEGWLRSETLPAPGDDPEVLMMLYRRGDRYVTVQASPVPTGSATLVVLVVI